MGTGKPRISTAGKVLEAKAEGEPVLELELVLVQAELELVLVAAAEELSQVVAEPETAPAVALELVIGPAAVPELETVPVVALALGIVLAVAQALEIDPAVVPELVIGQGQAELELVRAAVALRTKSVTAAHRPDLVPLLEAEEDLAAAVAETTREPAAAEAVIAWEVAE
jgi:hypothetical protein